MAGALLLIIVLAPALAIALILAVPKPWASAYLNLISSVVAFAAAAALPWVTQARVYLGGYIIIDPLGAWVTLCAAIVYLLASIYAVGYMPLLGQDERLPGFYALFAGFALTILVGR